MPPSRTLILTEGGTRAHRYPAAITVREVFPYLHVNGAARRLIFTDARLAPRIISLTEPGGCIGHAEIKIGETTIMLSDEYPSTTSKADRLGGTSFAIHLHVDQVGL
jgi:uncharacterized glyoxalase superfamily protein PhnB